MRNIFLIPFLFLSAIVFGQKTDAELKTQVQTEILNKTYAPTRMSDMLNVLIDAKPNAAGVVSVIGTNTLTATVTGFTTYTNKVMDIRVQNNNTGAVTVNITGQGPKAVKKQVSVDLEADDFQANGVYRIAYDGTNFQLVGGSGGGGSGVQTVTGDGVDNTDPANPIISFPTKSDIGLGSVENTTLSTWPGTANIVLVGTIGTGNWNASIISPTYGGTGINNGARTLTISTNSGTFSFTNPSTTLTIANTASISGTNTGDQTTVTGNAGTATALQNARTIGIVTGDATSSGSSFDGTGNNTNALTLATVNSNVGSFGSSTAIPVITVNGKGLGTAYSTAAVVAPAGTLTGTTLASGVVTSSITTLGSSASLPGSPTTTTQSAGDNSTKIATTAYADAKVANVITDGVNAIAPSENAVFDALALKQGIPSAIGALYTETFASLASYTNVGSATFNLTGGHVDVSGGAGNLTNYLRLDAVPNNFEKWKISETVTVGTINGTSHGIGIGIESQGASTQLDWQFNLSLSTASQGKILTYYNNSFTAVQTSSGVALAITAGDQVKFEVELDRDIFYMTATNLTTGLAISDLLRLTFAFPQTNLAPNYGKFSLYAIGGSHTLTAFSVTSSEYVGADLVIVGNSIGRGYTAGTIGNRFADRIGQKYFKNIAVVAGAGNTVADQQASSAQTKSILTAASTVIIELGTNDLAAGRTAAQIATDIGTLKTDYETTGATVKVLSLIPRGSNDVAATNTQLKSTFGSAYIDVYNSLKAVSGTSGNTAYFVETGSGLLHPNGLGHQIIANYISNTLYPDLPSKQLPRPPVKNTVSGADVVGLGSQMHWNNSDGRDGAYVTTIGGSYMGLSGGAYYDGTNFIASSTNASILVQNGGSYIFNGNTGTTVGSSFTPTERFAVTNAGSIRTGSTGSGVYRATNAGGDVTASMIFDPANSLTSGNSYMFDATAGALCFLRANGTRRILRAGIGLLGNTDTGGSETSTLSFSTMSAGASSAERLRLDVNSWINGTLNVGGGAVIPNSTIQVTGSFAAGYVAKTANYTLTISDYLVNCTANSFTITLPTAVGITGREYIIKNTGTATVITMATTSSQTIDGAAPGTITTMVPLRVISDGANWITY